MPDRPRVLWLHNQPEHYFNLMMDELNASSDLEYIAAFSYAGAGVYTERSQPARGQTVFLRPLPGKTGYPAFFGKHHIDWKSDLLPLNYDVAIVSGYGSRTAREVVRDARRRGIPVAMWSDSNLRSQRGRACKARVKRSLKKRWLSPIIHKVDYMLTANSRGVAYWRYFGCAKKRIILCPCYSDYTRIETARNESRAALFARFNLDPAQKLLFTAARLVPAKGLDLAIKAFIAGDYAKQGWRFFIAGAGPLEQELKRLAGPQLDSAIRFIGFQQPSDNLALIAHADLFILPSRYEPHGIVIPEAMAAGTPVLVSDIVGSAFDLVRPGVTGDFFRSEDTADLRAKLDALLLHPEKLAAMRPHVRAEFEKWFAETSPIKVVDQIAHRMLAEKRAVAGGCA